MLRHLPFPYCPPPRAPVNNSPAARAREHEKYVLHLGALLLLAHLVDRPLVERVGKGEVTVELPVEGRLPVAPGHRCRFDGLEAVLAEVNADD